MANKKKIKFTAQKQKQKQVVNVKVNISNPVKQRTVKKTTKKTPQNETQPSQQAPVYIRQPVLVPDNSASQMRHLSLVDEITRSNKEHTGKIEALTGNVSRHQAILNEINRLSKEHSGSIADMSRHLSRNVGTLEGLRSQQADFADKLHSIGGMVHSMTKPKPEMATFDDIQTDLRSIDKDKGYLPESNLGFRKNDNIGRPSNVEKAMKMKMIADDDIL